MGNARFLIDNLITSESMLTVTSERAGQVGLAVKVGGGSASLQASGPYTGANPGQYVVEIDSVVAGTGIGQATFRWRPTSTSTWSAQGVATATSPVVLETGLTVAWTTGGGTDLMAGDYWTITVDKPFGKAKLLDRDRDTEWRSADSVDFKYFTIDLGSAQRVDAVALLDTNLRSAFLMGVFGTNTLGNLWTAPSYYQTPYGGTNLVHYTAGAPTYRYWGIALYDFGNPDGYLRIGDLFLGSYTEFSGNFDRNWSRTKNAAVYGPSGALRSPRGVWAQAERIDLQYRLMTQADRTKVEALFDALYNPTTGTVKPVIFNFDSAVLSDVSLYELDSPTLPVASPFLGHFEWSLRLQQRPRIARSGS
jgi:hypothetical protein